MRHVTNSYEVPNWAASQRVGDVGTKATLMVLALHADSYAMCWPSQEFIAEETEQSLSTVYRQIRRLEKYGLVAVEVRYKWENGRKIRTSNRYHLQIDARFDVKIHGKDYDAAVSGPPDLPVNLTGRSEETYRSSVTGRSEDLPVNVTGRSDLGKHEDSRDKCGVSAGGPTGRPTGQTGVSTGHQVTDELPCIELPEKNNHSPLRGECVYAHDAHADAGTREDADHEPVRDDAPDPWAEDRPTVNPGTRNRTSATPNPVVDDRPGDNVDHAVNLTGCVAGDPVPTRLARTWQPTPDLLAWAAANVPGLDVDHETDEFVHYWAVEAPARDPKSPRARRPKPWEKVDWGRAWQNRMRDQWRRQGLDRRPRPAADELDLFADTTADTQPVADEITAWWGDQCRQRYGGVLPTALTKLRELVAQALVGGFDRDRVQAALVACAQAGEPFPPQWILQRALTGQPPRPPVSATGGTMTRQEAEQREWDERFARKLEEAAEFDAVGDYSDEAIIGSILSKAVQRAADTRQSEEPGVDVQQVKIIRKGIAQ